MNRWTLDANRLPTGSGDRPPPHPANTPVDENDGDDDEDDVGGCDGGGRYGPSDLPVAHHGRPAVAVLHHFHSAPTKPFHYPPLLLC